MGAVDHAIENGVGDGWIADANGMVRPCSCPASKQFISTGFAPSCWSVALPCGKGFRFLRAELSGILARVDLCEQQRRAVEAAQDSLQLFTNRYRGGVDNYLQVITAQTALLTNQRTEIDILRRRMDASVLLVKAVGGGWDVSALPAP